MKTALAVFGAIVAFLVIITGLNFFGYASFSFFAPRYESVRRDVMIQSRAYTEAEIRRLYDFKLQYQQAKNDSEKSTIKAMAIHEFTVFDRDRLPTDLQLFAVTLGIYN